MKRTYPLILCAPLMLSLGSCGDDKSDNTSTIPYIEDIKKRNKEKRENDANEIRRAVNAKEKANLLLKKLSEYDKVVVLDMMVLTSNLTNDLKVDSLGRLELMMDIEDLYKTKLSSDDFKNVETIEDLIRYIQKLDEMHPNQSLQRSP